MRYCKDCGMAMTGVMSFSKDNNEKFFDCPRCHSQTKHRKLRDDELDFGEVLKETIHKRK